jgi:DNA-binding MarR family transcriptional regulator
LAKDEPRAARGQQIAAELERLSRLLRAAEHEGDLNPAQREAMRYLTRANRFSNSPAALTRYLGATKGTISQTIKSLAQKGYLSKTGREGERRSVALKLTDKGLAALSSDPWVALADSAQALRPKMRRRLARGLASLLAVQIERQGHASFGTCATCQHFAKGGGPASSGLPHRCRFFGAALSDGEALRICAGHQRAGEGDGRG